MSDGDLFLDSAGDIWIEYTEGATIGGGERVFAPRAQMMLSWLPTFFRSTPEYQALMQAYGNEMDRLEAARQQVIAQALPHTADILLSAWEWMLRISISPPGLSIAERRRRVMVQYAKLTTDPSGLGWRANVALLVGTGWSYEEFVPPDQRRLNLATNPRAETNATTYAQTAGTGSHSRITATHPPEVDGTHVIEQVNPGRGAGEGVRIGSVDADDPAGAYTGSVFVRTRSGTMALAIDVEERDGGDALLATTTTRFTATTDWQRVRVTRQFADDGVNVRAAVRADGTVAGTFQVVGLVLERSDVLGTYFDGATAGFEWLGTADGSQSRATSPDEDTLLVTLPYPPDSDLYAQTERLLREITPSHVDLVLAFVEGFVLDESQLDEEPLR